MKIMSARRSGKATEMFLRESNAIEGVYDEDSFEQAFIAWEFLIDKEELTVPVILHTHKILMLNSGLMPDQKGYIRNIPVYIGGHEAWPVPQIRSALNAWLREVHVSIKVFKEENDPDHVSLFQSDHVAFELIHPFVDGNGRIGRMLMNWSRVHAGLPLLVIKASERQAYYQWFK